MYGSMATKRRIRFSRASSESTRILSFSGIALSLIHISAAKIERWYQEDNCRSKNEFIEKAVNCYADMLEMCIRDRGKSRGGTYQRCRLGFPMNVKNPQISRITERRDFLWAWKGLEYLNETYPPL